MRPRPLWKPKPPSTLRRVNESDGFNVQCRHCKAWQIVDGFLCCLRCGKPLFPQPKEGKSLTFVA